MRLSNRSWLGVYKRRRVVTYMAPCYLGPGSGMCRCPRYPRGLHGYWGVCVLKLNFLFNMSEMHTVSYQPAVSWHQWSRAETRSAGPHIPPQPGPSRALPALGPYLPRPPTPWPLCPLPRSVSCPLSSTPPATGLGHRQWTAGFA